MMHRSCDNCRHFHTMLSADLGEHFGTCHRNPPRLVPFEMTDLDDRRADVEEMTRWPTVFCGDLCGEHDWSARPATAASGLGRASSAGRCAPGTKASSRAGAPSGPPDCPAVKSGGPAPPRPPEPQAGIGAQLRTKYQCDQLSDFTPDRSCLLAPGHSFGRPSAVLPVGSPAPLQTFGRAWSGTRAAVHPAAAIRHRRTRDRALHCGCGRRIRGPSRACLKCLPPAGRMGFIGLIHPSPLQRLPPSGVVNSLDGSVTKSEYEAQEGEQGTLVRQKTLVSNARHE